MEQNVVIEDEENRAWTMASTKHSEKEKHVCVLCSVLFVFAYEWEVTIIERDVNVRALWICFSADEKRTKRVTLKFNNWIDAHEMMQVFWAREMSDTQNQLHGIGFCVIFNRIRVFCVAWHCLLLHIAYYYHSFNCLFICFVLPARHQKKKRTTNRYHSNEHNGNIHNTYVDVV